MIRVAITLALLAPGMAHAEWQERWTATSTTAMSITGDVTLLSDRMVFATGKSLPISKVKNITFTDDIGEVGPATIYKVTSPADPILLNGNQLCGKAVTYVVIWRPKPFVPRGPAERALAAYSGSEPGTTANDSCGTFRYEIVK